MRERSHAVTGGSQAGEPPIGACVRVRAFGLSDLLASQALPVKLRHGQ